MLVGEDPNTRKRADSHMKRKKKDNVHCLATRVLLDWDFLSAIDERLELAQDLAQLEGGGYA